MTYIVLPDHGRASLDVQTMAIQQLATISEVFHDYKQDLSQSVCLYTVM